MDTFIAPLRASRAALVPYIETIQDSASTTAQELRAKAQDLVHYPSKSARLLGNRYVLMSLAAGVCFLAVRRLQRWRRANGRAKTGSHRATRQNGSAPRKSTRATSRARVH
jgi:hypothetical protein